MTAFNALEILKNRITTLSLNHKIGSRDIAQLEVKGIVMGIETHVIPTLEKALERAKKVEELLGLYKELGGIEQDIEYLCGLRDCMIEFSVEKPMEHIYSGIKEYKEKRDGLNYQINQLEGGNEMKQTVVEYYTQDGSIELAIRTHLKANPNQVVKFMGMTQHNYQGHYSQEVYGAYVLVIYEE